jgi:bisanhydrobacterioruberin hydratase
MGITDNHSAHNFLRYKRFVVVFFVIFYFVGFIGIAIPFSHLLFVKLVPVALLISLIALLLFHQVAFDTRTILVLATIGLSGYMIEVVGVNTHLVFGQYQYGRALGLKIANTPVLIGLNWLMLTYAGSSIAERMSLPVWLKIIISSLLVLIYDIILERIAPAMDMWYWYNNIVPLQNYIAWFMIALLFQILIKASGIHTKNSIAFVIMLSQCIFFFSLIILFNLTR